MAGIPKRLMDIFVKVLANLANMSPCFKLTAHYFCPIGRIFSDDVTFPVQTLFPRPTMNLQDQKPGCSTPPVFL